MVGPDHCSFGSLFEWMCSSSRGCRTWMAARWDGCTSSAPLLPELLPAGCPRAASCGSAMASLAEKWPGVGWPSSSPLPVSFGRFQTRILPFKSAVLTEVSVGTVHPDKGSDVSLFKKEYKTFGKRCVPLLPCAEGVSGGVWEAPCL